MAMSDKIVLDIVPIISADAVKSIKERIRLKALQIDSIDIRAEAVANIQAKIRSQLVAKTQKQLEDEGASPLEKIAKGGGIAAGIGMALPTAAMAGIGTAVGGVQVIISMVSKFIESANPGVIEQLGLVLEDATAVIGYSLIPIIQSLIPLIRLWGDFLASILPAQTEVNVLMLKFTPILESIKKVFEYLAPLIHSGLVTGLNMLAVVIQVLAPVIGWLADNVNIFVRALIFAQGVMVGVATVIVVSLIPAIITAATTAITSIAAVATAIPGGMLAAGAGIAAGLAALLLIDIPNPGEVAELRSARGAATRGAEFVGVGNMMDEAIRSAFGMGNLQQREADDVQTIKEQLNLMMEHMAAAGMWLGERAGFVNPGNE